MSSFKESQMMSPPTPSSSNGDRVDGADARANNQQQRSSDNHTNQNSDILSRSDFNSTNNLSATSSRATTTSTISDHLRQVNSSPGITTSTSDTTNQQAAAMTSTTNQRKQQQQQQHNNALSASEREALDRVSCVDELEVIARERMSKMVYEYYCGGADDELTLKWNRQMISEKYLLRPRVMCDVSRVDTTKYIYGDRLAMPIGISPSAMHKMAHPGGELATVRACARANALMILSLFSTTSLEDVARAEPICTKWQNLYILKDRDVTTNIITRAMRNAYRAIVVTCDAPILGNRRADKRNQLSLAEYPLENLRETSTANVREHSSSIFDPSVTWQDLADLKKQVGDSVRVIAKGIMTPEDAEQALQAGVDGVYVSNHGGRQLDGCQSTIEALPAIVRAVNKRCPVLVDGGFRTGADILKALALGADMVFVGRPPLMGLASFGEEGVYAVLQMLQDELKRAMMLCGCNKLSDINRNIILERQ